MATKVGAGGGVVESAVVAGILPLNGQKVVLSINGNSCHAGENTYAVLSINL
jgi:hypothetical protein